MAEFKKGDRVKSHGGEAVGHVERKITERTKAVRGSRSNELGKAR
jgi:hypothetical protein